MFSEGCILQAKLSSYGRVVLFAYYKPNWYPVILEFHPAYKAEVDGMATKYAVFSDAKDWLRDDFMNLNPTLLKVTSSKSKSESALE